MSEIKLDNRLMTAAELVRLNGRIVDVGTDHALLPCFLKKKGAKEVIAADVNPNPLKAAKATLERFGEDIPLVLSDGLRGIDYADDVIIAGMGGELISRIVTECHFLDRDPHFILQPMTRAEVLRRELYENGFEILEEKTAVATGKIYTVILARYCGNKTEISEKFAYCGKNNDRIYLEKQVFALRKKAKGNPACETLAQEIENDYCKRDL